MLNNQSIPAKQSADEFCRRVAADVLRYRNTRGQVAHFASIDVVRRKIVLHKTSASHRSWLDPSIGEMKSGAGDAGERIEDYLRGLPMRASMIGLSALALVASAAPALAQDDTKEFTLSGTAALVSEYRFRGISQSDKRIVPQASATLTHASGAYVSFWSSAIASDTVYPGANAELDLIAGYSTTVSGFTLDGGVLYYVYPNADSGVNSDFLEPYGSVKYTVGPVTAKGGFAYAFKQKAIAFAHSKDDNLYVYGELSGAIPDTGFSLLGHLGYSHGRSYLTLGQKGYLDWNVGASYTIGKATFSVSYVDTDIKKFYSVYGHNGRDQAKAGVVGAVTFAF